MAKISDFYLTLDLADGTANTAAIRKNHMDGYSIMASWGASATRAGSLKLQGSNNAYMRQPNGDTAANMQEIIQNDQENASAVWVDIPGSTKTVDATADTHVWNVTGAHYSYVRVVYTESASGAADPDPLTMFFHGQSTGY